MLTNKSIELFLQALEGVMSPATVVWYRHRLAPLRDALGHRHVERLTVDRLRAWRAEVCRRPLSEWTLHGHIRAARRFFKWLVEEGRLKQSPAARLELPALHYEPAKGISAADVLKMTALARTQHPRDYALCLLLADTGARVGGVAGLTVADLDFISGRAMVREKGGKSRAVYLTRRTCSALRDYLGGRRSGPVFLSYKGNPLKAGGIYQALERIAKRAEVTGRWNPHAWRHGTARGWLKAGANLAQVSQMLGHSDVGVTVKFYGAFVDEELKAAHTRYTVVREDGD